MSNGENEFRTNLIITSTEHLKSLSLYITPELMYASILDTLYDIDKEIAIDISNTIEIKEFNANTQCIDRFIHEFYVKWITKNKISDTMFSNLPKK